MNGCQNRISVSKTIRLLCFLPVLGFEFSQKIVHWSHTGMWIAFPHKNNPGFFNTGYSDQCAMVIPVSLVYFW